MPNLVKKLWDLYLLKKEALSEIIKDNIQLFKKLLFINQSAEVSHLMEEDDIPSLIKLQTTLLDHGYCITRILEFVDFEELIDIQFEDLPLITDKRGIQNNEFYELLEFIRKIRPLYNEEISILYLILNLKKKRIRTEIRDKDQIVIYPPNRNRNIQRSICINLSNENSLWSAQYSHENLVKDDLVFTLEGSSGIGKLSKIQLKDNWDLFCEFWEKLFRNSLKLTYRQFLDTLEYLTLFKNNLPFSKNNLKSKELEEIPGQVLSNLLSIAEQVLPSFERLPKLESINSINDIYFKQIKELGIGWKFLSKSKEIFLYSPSKNSLLFFLERVFEELFENIDIAGEFYEEELRKRISFLNDGKIKIRGTRKSLLGFFPEYVTDPKKLKQIFEVNILEKNLPINVPEVRKYGIEEEGEIDLLIHSNNNLFILEAKSFFGKKITHAFQKASVQCTKYREWIDTTEFKEIVEKKHGITKFKKIFILVITNRQDKRLYTKCTKSNFYFPFISFSMLPLLLLGLYIEELSVKKLIPEELINILVNITKNNFPDYEIIDDPTQFEAYRSIWRIYMHIILYSSSLDQNFDFSKLKDFALFGTGYRNIDHMIGDPTKWELADFMDIGEVEGYKIKLITQLSNNHQKFICHNCKIIWIYYFPGDDLGEKKFFEELINESCIECHEKIEKDPDNEINLRLEAGTLLMMMKVAMSKEKFGEKN